MLEGGGVIKFLFWSCGLIIVNCGKVCVFVLFVLLFLNLVFRYDFGIVWYMFLLFMIYGSKLCCFLYWFFIL